jgi:hypothetical protein
MAEEKLVGDDGFGPVESQAAADCAAYYTYKGYMRDLKYSHEQALNTIGYSEEEFKPILEQYEPTDNMLS